MIPRWATVASLVRACREHDRRSSPSMEHAALVGEGRFDLVRWRRLYDEETVLTPGSVSGKRSGAGRGTCETGVGEPDEMPGPGTIGALTNRRIIGLAVANAPVAVREAIGALVHQTSSLQGDALEDRETHQKAVRHACRSAQDVMRMVTEYSEDYGIDLAAGLLDDLVTVVDSLCAISSHALPIQADLVSVYGAARDYQGAIDQALRTIALPGRRASTSDLLELGTWLMNACEFEPARQVLDAVSRHLRAGGPMSPPTYDEQVLQRVTADQFRLLWIPHDVGRPETTIRNYRHVLARGRTTNPRIEAGILHRLGRARTDLAMQRHDSALLARAEDVHLEAMKIARGEYNFHMPMALYYTQQQAHRDAERSLAETYELSTGMGEGARAHIALLDARRYGTAGRLYAGIESVSQAIQMWQRHPHPTGVVNSLTTRAALSFRLATAPALADATADLLIARRLARSRGFDLDSASRALLLRCLNLLDPRARRKIGETVRLWESERSTLLRRPGPALNELLARL